MLRVLGYIWAIFGAYWIIFAPALNGERSRVQKSRLAFLAITFVLLLWKAQATPPLWLIALALTWSAAGLYWVAPKKVAQSGEYAFYRLLRLLVGAVTFSLLFWNRTSVGILGSRFVPRVDAVSIAGFLLTLLGLAITAWARIHLGRHWSDKVVIQSDHELVRTGPYAHVRHPIYSCVLLGVAGTVLVVGVWRAILAFAVMLSNSMVHARREDKI